MEDGEAGHGHTAEPAGGEGAAGGSAGWHPGDAAEAERTVLHSRGGIDTGGLRAVTLRDTQ